MLDCYNRLLWDEYILGQSTKPSLGQMTIPVDDFGSQAWLVALVTYLSPIDPYNSLFLNFVL